MFDTNADTVSVADEMCQSCENNPVSEVTFLSSMSVTRTTPMHSYGLGSAFPPTAHLLIRLSRGNLCGIVFVGDHMVAEPSSKIMQLDGMDGWNAQRRSPNIPGPRS
jgi:hypothetical protein